MSTKNLQKSSSGSAFGLGSECSWNNALILDPGCPEASTKIVRFLWGLGPAPRLPHDGVQALVGDNPLKGHLRQETFHTVIHIH